MIGDDIIIFTWVGLPVAMAAIMGLLIIPWLEKRDQAREAIPIDSDPE